MKQKTYIATLLVFALAVSLLGPIVAFAADSGACYSLGSADARTYCLAKAHKNSSICYSIKSAEIRAMCLSETRK